jgi:protein-tyrosine phosphatase
VSIDRIPVPRTDGALWLCGRNDVGPDPEAALAWADASTIVCLNHIDELAMRFPEYVEWLRTNMGGRAIWYPIQNFRAPSARSVMPVVEMITDRLERGEGVVMHCAAGQGRAGTLAACVLMALGASTADAVRTVATHRVFAGPGSPSQWALVEGVAAHLAAANADPGQVHGH